MRPKRPRRRGYEDANFIRDFLLFVGPALPGAHGAASPDAAQGLVSDVRGGKCRGVLLDAGRVSGLGCGQKTARMVGHTEPASW